MKKFIIFLVAAILPIAAGAQAQINTKKTKLADFYGKTTKVVLSGNPFIDEDLKTAIRNNWTISPYEFCTLEEFGALKTSADYYFLMIAGGQFKKEADPGIEMFSLLKGGPDAAKGVNKMLEVVSLPLRSSESPSGREIVFLPAFIDIIQKHVQGAIEKDINAYGGLATSNANMFKSKNIRVVFSEDDLAENVPEELLETLEIADEDAVDAMMEEGVADVMVSYVVCPNTPQLGSYCYKMLIGTADHTLYYFTKTKINDASPAGFQEVELRRICPKKRDSSPYKGDSE